MIRSEPDYRTPCQVHFFGVSGDVLDTCGSDGRRAVGLKACRDTPTLCMLCKHHLMDASHQTGTCLDKYCCRVCVMHVAVGAGMVAVGGVTLRLRTEVAVQELAGMS